jgi:hypothetical protein
MCMAFSHLSTQASMRFDRLIGKFAFDTNLICGCCISSIGHCKIPVETRLGSFAVPSATRLYDRVWNEPMMCRICFLNGYDIGFL